MANQNLEHRKENIGLLLFKGIRLDYCPNSPDTRHVFIQQEHEPEVKQCFWCNLLVLSEDQEESA